MVLMATHLLRCVRRDIKSYDVCIVCITGEPDIVIRDTIDCGGGAITNSEFTGYHLGITPGCCDVGLLRWVGHGVIGSSTIVLICLRWLFPVECASDPNENDGIESAGREGVGNVIESLTGVCIGTYTTGPVSISVGSGSSIVNAVRPEAVVGVTRVGGVSVAV